MSVLVSFLIRGLPYRDELLLTAMNPISFEETENPDALHLLADASLSDLDAGKAHREGTTIRAMMKRDNGRTESEAASLNPARAGQDKILVAYFSWSGNTRKVANQIHKIVGGDFFEIVSVDKYPSEYSKCLDQAKRELGENYLPKLKSEVEDVESYEVILVGYPNWYDTIPRPVASFLTRCDSSRKTIAPFCTHGGDGLGESIQDITKLCPQSTVLEGLAIRSGDAGLSKDKVSGWLRKIGVIK